MAPSDHHTSYYSIEELSSIGFRAYGQDVLLSRKVSIYGAGRISLGSHVRIDDFGILSGKLQLGDHVHIAAYVALYGASAGIVVADFSGISARCTVYAASDDYLGGGLTGPTIPKQFRCVDEKLVTINRHVVIGAGSVVLPGAEVGEGVTVGALSLVTGSCTPWMVYAGVPARPIKPRRRDIIEAYRRQLQESDQKPVN